VALKRDKRTLSGLKCEEWEDLVQLLEEWKKQCKPHLTPPSLLGMPDEHFYLEDTLEPHLHWHFIPRYNHPVEFAGHKFEDPHFGYMRPRPPKEISEDVRNRIADKIREFL
jgi:diadenosine tetraphosphate (Ap4A) HIT family hydrolase